MSLVINNNLLAMNASRNLGTSYSSLQTSTRRLSSGLRITQSSDDAAGLAVRELMRADIRSLQQGIRNANDAISLIQTADGALGVIDEKLIRMKELAMQASTGTYNSDQRLIIDSEYQAMASEITRIANSTDFNGVYLLNGNLSGTHSGSGLVSSGRMKVHFGTGNDCAEDYYYIQINSATASALGFGGGSSSSSSVSLTKALADQIVAKNFSGFTFDSEKTFATVEALVQTNFKATGQTLDDSSPAFAYVAPGSDFVHVAQAEDGSIWYNRYRSGWIVNATEYDTGVSSSSSSASSISTQQLAQQALETIDNAIISKDKIRANLGALQNRFENTVTVLEIQAENMQAAESRISDVDVAKEMTKFVRNQILTQAAVSMLSQANSLPRMALSLIG